VPTRDRLELVRVAVQAILDQTYAGPIECIVVFDQSDPHPIDVAERPGRQVRTIRNHRTPGLAGARNSGVLAADGPLVAFCDDDDEWLPGKIEAQVRLLAELPDAALVACGILVRFEGKDRSRPAPGGPLRRRDFLRDRLMEINPCTALIRRNRMLEEIGLVDEEIPGGYGEDYEWLLRAAERGPVHAVPEPFVRVNWHTSSFFADRWRVIIEALHYLLDSYPDFRDEPAGLARIEGQLAFAHAGLGERRQARQWAARAVRHRWTEQRAYAALLASTGLVSNDTIIRLAHRAGRGI